MQDALDAAFPNHWRVPMVAKPSQTRLSASPASEPAAPLPLSSSHNAAGPAPVLAPLARSTDAGRSSDSGRVGQLGLALPPPAKDLHAPRTGDRRSALYSEVQENRRSTDPPPMIASPKSSSEGARLPAGWEARTDPQGRIFYVDHNTHTTHWVPPPAQPTKSLLPPGWSQQADPQGRVYYINHNAKSTHWVLPPNVLAWIEQNNT